MSEEDLDWIDKAARSAIVEALARLINSHDADQEEGASYLDERGDVDAGYAATLENRWRPRILRQALESGFARNAERKVSHASSERRIAAEQLGRVVFSAVKGQPSAHDCLKRRQLAFEIVDAS